MCFKRLAWVWTSAISSVLISACGGGGSSTSSTPASAPGSANFTISDPYSTQVASVHRTYFSTFTSALRITINGSTVQISLSPSSPGCTVANATISCSAGVPAPNGAISFTVEALDANGRVLSQGSGTATINGATTVPLSLDGVWKTAVVRLANENPAMGNASTIPITVSAFDPDGALIVGPEPFTSPLPLYNTDTTGATSLSASSVSGPGATVTLNYNGTSFVNASISAAVPFAQSEGAGDTMIPAARTVEYAIPSGSQTWEATLNGKILANPNGTLSFAERTPTDQPAIGTVTTSGSITETSALTPGFEDIALDAGNNIWGVTNTAQLAQYTGAGAGFVSSAFPDFSSGPLTLGADGNFWMQASGASGGTIERVTPAGTATNFPLPAGIENASGGVLAGDGNVWFLTTSASQPTGLVSITTAGAIADYPLPSSFNCCSLATNMALGPDGAIYFLPGLTTLGRVTTSGVFSSMTIAFVTLTSIDGESSKNPMAFGPDGALWISTGGFASSCDPFVERVTTTGAYAYLEIPISCNTLNGPSPSVSAFAIGSDGNLWYTRGSNVGKIVL
jgi:hypothetical protein